MQEIQGNKWIFGWQMDNFTGQEPACDRRLSPLPGTQSNTKLQECEQIIYRFKALDLEITYIFPRNI